MFFKQKGVALITVLFMFALVAVVLSGLLNLTRNDINRSSHYFASEQAWLLCLSGEEMARQLLMEDFKKNKEIDHTQEKWAESGLSMNIGNGSFSVVIEDAQGKFNLNNLVSAKSGATEPKYKEALANLLNIALDDKPLATKLAGQAADWIDTDKTGGTEEFDYLSEEVSYRPPNSAVGGVSELRWLKDMEGEHYQLIRHSVLADMTVLPAGTLINVNTITASTLAALAGIDIEVAESMVESIRENKQGYSNKSQALSLLSANSRTVIEPFLDVKSSYFEVRVRAQYGEQYAYLKTRLKRDANGNSGKGSIEVISRNKSRDSQFFSAMAGYRGAEGL